ncbi:TetR/AcrR family transcriptional regulator [Rhodococcus sp. HNM0569]|uniref:TetR/AcrR family transcriptional regulator n=1 Tax=Rhodococcus sp. HNM0569 TaxID=2716340 RepID=UPI001469A764|nr:TetR/AcrR family transcriptional regulator [Rhodococcus sp. HNM0569]NLU82337.1 TetR/AcrR family transcriptional regulator [Rhodococcus sp. HNM0569]
MSEAAHPRRSERARTAVLDATAELIREVPYPKITVEGIAARAGVGKQTIYRWWPSKGAVVVDVLARDLPDGDAYALPDTGDLAVDMLNVLRATENEFAGEEFSAFYRAILIEAMGDAPLRARIAEVLFSRQLDAAHTRFASARAAGQMRDDVADAVAFELFFGPTTHRWQTGALPLGDEHADAVVALAMRAIAP